MKNINLDKVYKTHFLCLLILTTFLSFGCKDSHVKKRKMAKSDADYIIENLDSYAVAKMFPASTFKDDEIINLIEHFKNNCKYQEKIGDYLKYDLINKEDKKYTAFIYEYNIDCGDVRFTLVFDTDEKKPFLYSFNMEPL